MSHNREIGARLRYRCRNISFLAFAGCCSRKLADNDLSVTDRARINQILLISGPPGLKGHRGEIDERCIFPPSLPATAEYPFHPEAIEILVMPV